MRLGWKVGRSAIGAVVASGIESGLRLFGRAPSVWARRKLLERPPPSERSTGWGCRSPRFFTQICTFEPLAVVCISMRERLSGVPRASVRLVSYTMHVWGRDCDVYDASNNLRPHPSCGAWPAGIPFLHDSFAWGSCCLYLLPSLILQVLRLAPHLN